MTLLIAQIQSPDQSKSPNRLKTIDKGTRNARRFRGASPSLSKEEENCLDEDVLVTLLELALKIRDSQVYKRHDVASLDPKSGRAQYKEG